MIEYVFTTIAIGEKYFLNACNFARNLNEISKTHKIVIVTDCDFVEIENVTFINFNKNEVTKIKNYFNYNLKYIPIMECSKKTFEFIIFFDADWDIHDGYNENKFVDFLNSIKESNFDFIYERPHSIGGSKLDFEKCFWRHKIEPYGLLKTNFYDDAQVVNEQFLIFKNNEKLKIFVQKWKERNEFGVEQDIWAFAEGVEIGMSAVDAKMVMDWKPMFELRNFFKFSTNTGVIHIRF
jgi:hypothetical protein